MRLAALIVACIPSVYALIYLSSIWDPRSQSVALPVGLVNLDDGVNYRDSTFNIGLNLVGQPGYFCAHENELTKGKAARGRKLRRFI